MNIKLSFFTAAVSAALASGAFAGDIKPLHPISPLSNVTLPATAGQICDMYRLRVPAAAATKLYISAAVQDRGGVAKPKLGVKVGKWNGSDCVAAGAAEGQTHAMHVTGGGLAYDEGTSVLTCTSTINQWPLAGGSTTADNNTIYSKYSTMNRTTADYCIQVCKYPSSQHTGTAPTNAGAETYTVNTHIHNAATSSQATSGHCDVNNYDPIFVSQLCNDTLHASCAYSF
jgi:hypothetical protein